MKIFLFFRYLIFVFILTGCVLEPEKLDQVAYDNQPKSVLILMPKNKTTTAGVENTVVNYLTRPFAENGFYVFPIAVVEQLFKQNGITVIDEMHLVNTNKLKEIFNADAVLFVDIEKYGTNFLVLNKEYVVTLSAKLVDLRTNELIWKNNVTETEIFEPNSSNFLLNLTAVLLSNNESTLKKLTIKASEKLFNQYDYKFPKVIGLEDKK